MGRKFFWMYVGLGIVTSAVSLHHTWKMDGEFNTSAKLRKLRAQCPVRYYMLHYATNAVLAGFTWPVALSVYAATGNMPKVITE